MARYRMCKHWCLRCFGKNTKPNITPCKHWCLKCFLRKIKNIWIGK